MLGADGFVEELHWEVDPDPPPEPQEEHPFDCECFGCSGRAPRDFRELVGDAPVWDSYPGYALTAAVDGLLADFAAMQENCPEVVNPSGGEDRPDEGAYYAGVEEFLDRIAAKNDGGLPAHMAEDAEL